MGNQAANPDAVKSIPVMRASDLVASSRAGAPGVVEPPTELSGLLPAGISPGSLVAISGREGSGVATLCYRMLASGTAAGGYAALLDPGGRAVPLAVLEAGVDLSRFILVRMDAGASRERLASVLGALLDGFSVVGVLDPQIAGASLWRRAAGRVRERKAVLVAAGDVAAVSEAATLLLSLDSPEWQLDAGGMLTSRTARVSVAGSGMPRSERVCLSPPLPGAVAATGFEEHHLKVASA